MWVYYSGFYGDLAHSRFYNDDIKIEEIVTTGILCDFFNFKLAVSRTKSDDQIMAGLEDFNIKTLLG